MTHGTSEMQVLRIRRKITDLLLLARGRIRGLLLRSGFRDKAATIRAKAKVDHPIVGDTLGLRARQGRGHVKRDNISRKALHKGILLRSQARWARAHKPGLQGPRGESMPLHLMLSLQISRLFRVLFYSLSSMDKSIV